jgi:hypothetical protein
VKSKIKKSIDYNVPPMFWAKRALDAFIHSTHDSVKKRKIKTRHALDAFIESTHEGAKRFAHQHPVYIFKAGAELANKVK